MGQLPLRMFRKILFSSHYNGTPCWVWTGCLLKGGYGLVGFDGKVWVAHRAIYSILIGPIPEGLQLDHLCRNRACCNPYHLEPVTQQENIRRGQAGINLSVVQKSKTHCPAGHEYTPENTKLYRTSRYCRACDRDRHRLKKAAVKV